MMLSDDWKEIVRKLAAILRIADAFDRKHNGSVKYVSVEVKDREVIFSVQNEMEEIEIERWSICRRKDFFEQVYKRKLKIACFVDDKTYLGM